MQNPSAFSMFATLRPHSTYCAGCSGVFSSTQMKVDRIVPAHVGGKAVITNLAYLCADCKEAKGNNLPGRWEPTNRDYFDEVLGGGLNA